MTFAKTIKQGKLSSYKAHCRHSLMVIKALTMKRNSTPHFSVLNGATIISECLQCDIK